LKPVEREYIFVQDLNRKVELIRCLDSNLIKRLRKTYEDFGCYGISNPHQSIKQWTTSKTDKITKIMLKQLFCAINEWLSRNHPQIAPFNNEYEIQTLSFDEFWKRLLVVESDNPLPFMSDDELIECAKLYVGFYDCRLVWVSREGEPANYNMIIRIGEQQIEGDQVRINDDRQIKKSVNLQGKYIKCYLSTYHSWNMWRKREGLVSQKKGDDLNLKTLIEASYKKYPWWNGELVKIPGYGDLLWFRFWDLNDGKRQCVITTKYKSHKHLINRLDGLMLAQPGFEGSNPCCTRFSMNYIGLSLKLSEIVERLNSMNYVSLTQDDDRITNKISDLCVLESYLIRR
jgi:hypothetical protein